MNKKYQNKIIADNHQSIINALYLSLCRNYYLCANRAGYCFEHFVFLYNDNTFEKYLLRFMFYLLVATH